MNRSIIIRKTFTHVKERYDMSMGTHCNKSPYPHHGATIRIIYYTHVPSLVTYLASFISKL